MSTDNPNRAGWYVLTAAGWSGPYRSGNHAREAGFPLGFTRVRYFSGE